MQESFERAAETPGKKRNRLEQRAKAIDEALRQPSKGPQLYMTPDMKVRLDGDEMHKRALKNQRVDLMQELESLDKTIKESLQERTIGKSLGRSR